MAALGKEVTQRAGACAEARKLHAALRKQIEVARRARARNLDTVDVACRKLIAKAGEEVQVNKYCNNFRSMTIHSGEEISDSFFYA